MTDGQDHPSYAADIESPGGFRNQVGGITLDVAGEFTLAESELSPGATS